MVAIWAAKLAHANQLYTFSLQPERIPRMPSSLSGRAATLALLTSSHLFEKLAPLLVSKHFSKNTYSVVIINVSCILLFSWNRQSRTWSKQLLFLFYSTRVQAQLTQLKYMQVLRRCWTLCGHVWRILKSSHVWSICFMVYWKPTGIILFRLTLKHRYDDIIWL